MATADSIQMVVNYSDVLAALREVPEHLRKRALSDAMRKAMAPVRKAAKAAAPVIEKTHPRVQEGVRAPGTLRKAISVRESKRDKSRGNVGFFVNVRPAKGARRGAKSPTDPFYWYWVFAGHKVVRRRKAYTKYRLRRGGGRHTGIAGRRRRASQFVAGRPYLRAGAAALQSVLPIFLAQARPAVERLNQRRIRAALKSVGYL